MQLGDAATETPVALALTPSDTDQRASTNRVSAAGARPQSLVFVWRLLAIDCSRSDWRHGAYSGRITRELREVPFQILPRSKTPGWGGESTERGDLEWLSIFYYFAL